MTHDLLIFDSYVERGDNMLSSLNVDILKNIRPGIRSKPRSTGFNCRSYHLRPGLIIQVHNETSSPRVSVL